MKFLFEEAVNRLGIDKATPKPILEFMRQRGHHNLNRENVASHLQKYRAKMKTKLEDGKDCRNGSIQDIVSSVSITSGGAASLSQVCRSSDEELRKGA